MLTHEICEINYPRNTVSSPTVYHLQKQNQDKYSRSNIQFNENFKILLVYVQLYYAIMYNIDIRLYLCCFGWAINLICSNLFTYTSCYEALSNLSNQSMQNISLLHVCVMMLIFGNGIMDWSLRETSYLLQFP